MKERKMSDYEIYYYFSAIEQFMLGSINEEFFIKNMTDEKFYEGLKLFIKQLCDENCYPVNCINKLKNIIKTICNKMEENWSLKYEILFQLLEMENWIDSNQYLEDTKNKHHGSLKDGLENKEYSKEELEQELNDSFKYFDLLINEQLFNQDYKIFDQNDFITFVKVLLQEGPSIITNEKYKNQLVYCLNTIIKNKGKYKREASYLLYQIKTGIFNYLDDMFTYDIFVDLVKVENIKKSFINPDIKSVNSIFTDEQLYSDGFRQCVELILDSMLEVRDNTDREECYNCLTKNKILDYLNDYDYYLRKNVKDNKEQIKWVNEQKVKLNMLTNNKIVSYVTNEVYSCFMSRLDAINFQRKDVTDELSFQFYSDVQYLNYLLLSQEDFNKVKKYIVKNKYTLRSIYKYLLILSEIYIDPTIYERTMYLINETIKQNDDLKNRLRVGKIKKKLANYYEEKSYERV